MTFVILYDYDVNNLIQGIKKLQWLYITYKKSSLYHNYEDFFLIENNRLKI